MAITAAAQALLVAAAAIELSAHLDTADTRAWRDVTAACFTGPDRKRAGDGSGQLRVTIAVTCPLKPCWLSPYVTVVAVLVAHAAISLVVAIERSGHCP